MSTAENGVCVRILEKELRIACPSHQEQALRDAARYVDEQMRKIQASKMIGIERVAMLAALNIANELLTLKNTPSELEVQFTERLKVLHDKVDGVLARHEAKAKEKTAG